MLLYNVKLTRKIWNVAHSEESTSGIDHAEEMELLLENYYRQAEDLANEARELRVLIDDSESIVFINLDRLATLSIGTAKSWAELNAARSFSNHCLQGNSIFMRVWMNLQSQHKKLHCTFISELDKAKQQDTCLARHQFSLAGEIKLLQDPSGELFARGNVCKFRGKIKFYSGKCALNSAKMKLFLRVWPGYLVFSTTCIIALWSDTRINNFRMSIFLSVCYSFHH